MSDNKLSTKWLPLESNPEVINKYVNNMGVSTEKYEFQDIYGLDNELLQMVPRPVIAVLLLFPVTEIYQDYRKKVAEEAKSRPANKNVYFVKQTVRNACGTVAIVHALSNNKNVLNIDNEKAFGKFLAATGSISPDERAEYLRTDNGITSAHQDSAQEGQTETPNIDDDVELHFIAFIEKDGDLFELDGAKEFAINHGPVNGDLLQATAEVVRKLIELNPEENRFNLIGLVAADN